MKKVENVEQSEDEKLNWRCVRDVGYRVIADGLHPDHATIARFRARHEKALGGLFSQVLRLLAAEGMVSLGLLSLDGTKLAGNAAQKANRTLSRAPTTTTPSRRRPSPTRTCG
jgi:transposase